MRRAVFACARQHQLMVFFVLAFGLTWAVEIPMYVFGLAILQVVLRWMPGLTAIVVLVFGPARVLRVPAYDAVIATGAQIAHGAGPGYGPVRSHLIAR